MRETYLKKRNAVILLFVVILSGLFLAPDDLEIKPSFLGNVISMVRIVGGALPPYFEHNLSNFTVEQTDGLFYDINCSDPEYADTPVYFDNFSGFEINYTTGVINVSYFNNSLVGNHTINITCSDLKNNVSKLFWLEILDSAEPPVLNPIGSKIAVEGDNYRLTISATDPDGDNLTYGTQMWDLSGNSVSLFQINPISGLVNFTPTISQVGNYTINFTVTDGLFFDWEVISFVIIRGPYCGDGDCALDESCVTCPTDCGQCEKGGGGGGGLGTESGAQGDQTAEGAGGGGGAGEAVRYPSTARQLPYICKERWVCTEWSICSLDGKQVRKCTDLNKCGSTDDKPEEIQNCTYVPTCSDGVKNGDEEGIDCGGSCPPCPSCFDGIQNQGETGVDCGGPCEPCEIKKFVKIPKPEEYVFFAPPRIFPWIILIVVAVLLTSTVVYDRAYLVYIKRQKFFDYRKRRFRYRAIQRRLYVFSLSVSAILVIFAFYLYIFSNKPDYFYMFLWAPISLILSAPFIISTALRYFTYYDYKRQRKVAILERAHKKHLRHLMMMEDELLYYQEKSILKNLVLLAKNKAFDKHRDFYFALRPIYSRMALLRKSYESRIKWHKVDMQVLQKMMFLVNDKGLKKAANLYPEFMELRKNLQALIDNRTGDTFDFEEDFFANHKELLKPHIRTVIESSPGLIRVGRIVEDINDYYKKKHEAFILNEKGVIKSEKGFLKEVQKLSVDEKTVQSIKGEAPIVKVYNGFIMLFNKYTKKHDLYSQMQAPGGAKKKDAKNSDKKDGKDSEKGGENGVSGKSGDGAGKKGS